jgi:hypothetical protein
VVALTVPNSTWRPPEPIVALTPVPPEAMYCSPPLDTAVPLATPNTTCRPLLMVAPVSVPPA